MDRTFHGQDISWTGHFMDRTFHGQDISRTGHFMDRTFHGKDISWQDISWTGHFTDRTFHGKDISWTGHFNDRILYWQFFSLDARARRIYLVREDVQLEGAKVHLHLVHGPRQSVLIHLTESKHKNWTKFRTKESNFFRSIFFVEVKSKTYLYLDGHNG